MISKIIRTSSSSNLIRYIENGEAHNKDLTDERCLAVGGLNVDKLGKTYDATYTSAQFTAVQQKAKNKHKKTKAYHMIFSFSCDDFPLPKNSKELHEQANQAGMLIAGFLSKDLPKNSQLFMGVQRDGKGKMLHVHVALNSVKLDGKVLNTNQIRLLDKGKEKGLRSRLDDYLDENFERITGRKYQRVVAQEDNLVNSSEVHIKEREEARKYVKTTYKEKPYAWKEHLKSLIYNAFDSSDSLDSFESALAENGVTVKKRQAGIGKDEDGKKIYRDAYTYLFTDENGKKHSIRDYAQTKSGGMRGLGKAFTPDQLKKELENGRSITREQVAEELEQQARSRQLDTANSSRNTTNSTTRSTEANDFVIDTTRLEASTRELANSDKSTDGAHEFIDYNFERQFRQFKKIQNVELDLQTLGGINERLYELKTNAERKRQQRKQQLEQRSRRIQQTSKRVEPDNTRTVERNARNRQHGRRLDDGLDF